MVHLFLFLPKRRLQIHIMNLLRFHLPDQMLQIALAASRLKTIRHIFSIKGIFIGCYSKCKLCPLQLYPLSDQAHHCGTIMDFPIRQKIPLLIIIHSLLKKQPAILSHDHLIIGGAVKDPGFDPGICRNHFLTECKMICHIIGNALKESCIDPAIPYQRR